MRPRVPTAWAALLALCPLLLGGCLFMPRKGQKVWVESGQGRYCSGAAMLTERTEDGNHCRVYVRNIAGMVESTWLSCQHVHPRR